MARQYRGRTWGLPASTVGTVVSPPFAAAVVVSIALLVTVLHCAASTLGHGYWFDEVYMLAIGRYTWTGDRRINHRLVPALAALMDAVAPGSQPALASPAALATGCAVVLAGLIAREFGCDRRAQVVTALAQATVLWTSLAGHWLTPYALEPAQWLLLIWLLIRWVRLRDDRLLIALGCVAGIAALTKLQVILLCVGACRRRRRGRPAGTSAAPGAVVGGCHRSRDRLADVDLATGARMAAAADGIGGRRVRPRRCTAGAVALRCSCIVFAGVLGVASAGTACGVCCATTTCVNTVSSPSHSRSST